MQAVGGVVKLLYVKRSRLFIRNQVPSSPPSSSAQTFIVSTYGLLTKREFPFFPRSWTETESRSVNSEKKRSQPILPKKLGQLRIYFLASGKMFLGGQGRKSRASKMVSSYPLGWPIKARDLVHFARTRCQQNNKNGFNANYFL